ncbi:hypothetical protein AMTR_s00061p00036000 [Amborella trichopoda]|uniref:Uncharacterized protein n=1 Tax=Amborella trichopoda TaxID=13333 RepID=U5D943_AMBTC|nr:hypothetical protein AMTR_s00061p00036000 [Amborella trichopoda]
MGALLDVDEEYREAWLLQHSDKVAVAFSMINALPGGSAVPGLEAIILSPVSLEKVPEQKNHGRVPALINR